MSPIVMDVAAIGAPPWQMWVTMIGILAAVAAYSYDELSMELTSAAVILGFLVFFHLFPLTGEDGVNLLPPTLLLAGLADPALIAILSLLIVGQGLFLAGALERPTQFILQVGRTRPRVTLMLVLLLVALTSAFLNNTPVAVMFIPIVAALAARANLLPSKVMMPLSFMCVLGGMTTLIGSSTNLLVAQTAIRAGVDEIGFFDFTGIGVILAATGAVYVMALLPSWLPSRGGLAETVVGDGKQFIAEIVLGQGHPLIGAKPSEGTFKELPEIKVRLIQRAERSLNPPFDDVELQQNDILVVVATRGALAALLSSKPGYLKGMIARGGNEGQALAQEAGDMQITQDLVMTEAVVAPGSRMGGYTIDSLGLRVLTGCIVLGIQRQSRMFRTNLQNIRLEAGDVLLLLGRRQDIRALRRNRDLLLLEWASVDLPNLDKAVAARWIFVGVVASAALGLLPIVVSAFAGALSMVVSGCLTIRQAARAIDRRIFLLVGSALAMGTALEHTGGALFLAQSLLNVLHGLSTPVILSAFFLLVAVITNVLSNNATAILFTPIAIGIAQQLEVKPLVFLVATILAANASFATPMAYQTNLLVMGPGQYRFSDYVRAGVPLTLLLWLAFSLVAPWYFGLA